MRITGWDLQWIGLGSGAGLGIGRGGSLLACRWFAAVALAVVLAGTAWAGGPTDPTPQSVPLFQDFGSDAYSSLPDGFAAWGFSNSISSQAEAEAANYDQDVPITATNSIPNNNNFNGSFGYSSDGNARHGMMIGPLSGQGTPALVMAIDSTRVEDLVLTYDIEVLETGVRGAGLIVQFLVAGDDGGWTTLPGTDIFGNQETLTVGEVFHYKMSLPGAVENQSNVQIRWASWQEPVAGNFTAYTIDNIFIPEPATLGLVGMGAMILFRRRRIVS